MSTGRVFAQVRLPVAISSRIVSARKPLLDCLGEMPPGEYEYSRQFLVGVLVAVKFAARDLDAKTAFESKHINVDLHSVTLDYIQYGGGSPDLTAIRDELRKSQPDPTKMLEIVERGITEQTVIGIENATLRVSAHN